MTVDGICTSYMQCTYTHRLLVILIINQQARNVTNPRTYQAKNMRPPRLSRKHRKCIPRIWLFWFLGMRSYHQWRGENVHVAGQEGELFSDSTHNTRTASINLILVIDALSACPFQRLQCNNNNNNNNMCMQENCPDHGIAGRKGGVIFCSWFTRFGSEMVIYWAARCIGVLVYWLYWMGLEKEGNLSFHRLRTCKTTGYNYRFLSVCANSRYTSWTKLHSTKSSW